VAVGADDDHGPFPAEATLDDDRVDPSDRLPSLRDGLVIAVQSVAGPACVDSHINA
jgi:hypothetical protein